ncbi:uncharacterized protein [Anabrus simplex]|uniref:uncharacterized protein n=1 Tax=Anabrus simplex TaxID=316456 RepID=UPI0035A2B4B9
MICAACGILIAVIIGVIVFFAVQKDDPKELPKTGDGDYRSNNQNSKLTPRQITNVQRLLREGVVNGGLRENYALVAHCQVSNVKESPGDNVYNVIKEWDHYSNYTLNEYFCSWKEANITDSGSHTVLPATLGKLLVSSSLLTALLTPGMR